MYRFSFHCCCKDVCNEQLLLENIKPVIPLESLLMSTQEEQQVMMARAKWCVVKRQHKDALFMNYYQDPCVELGEGSIMPGAWQWLSRVSGREGFSQPASF